MRRPATRRPVWAITTCVGTAIQWIPWSGASRGNSRRAARRSRTGMQSGVPHGDGTPIADADFSRERLVRAAQYVRMSTEHQRFSIDSQKIAIAKYANARGYNVVRTYADRQKRTI